MSVDNRWVLRRDPDVHHSVGQVCRTSEYLPTPVRVRETSVLHLPFFPLVSSFAQLPSTLRPTNA